MYIDAFPFPGLAAGTRLTITNEDLGIICESSLYSAPIMSYCDCCKKLERTLFCVAIDNDQVEVIGLTHIVGKDDIPFQVENGYTGAIKGHSRLVFP